MKRNMIKKIGVLTLSLLLALTSSTVLNLGSITAKEERAESTIQLAKDDPYWSVFGGNITTSQVIDSKTPIHKDDLIEKGVINGATFEPIIVGNTLYTVQGKNTLLKYSLDGDTSKNITAPLSAKTGYFSRLTYGDGKIFVALNNYIQAFDAQTLTPLWRTPNASKQMISTITYYNGYIYSGSTSGGGGSEEATNGYFFAVKTSDDDTTKSDETKQYAWYTKSENGTGYYWAGAAITQNALIFAGDDGKLISHHLTQDKVLDTYDLGKTKVRSNITYLADKNAVLVATQDTKKLYKIGMNENGGFDQSKVSSTTLKGQVTGAIGYYKGRIYLPSGGMRGNGFSVVDEATMEQIYEVDKMSTQSFPLITTAYASAENDYQVYVYLVNYMDGTIILMKDKQGQTTADIDTTTIPRVKKGVNSNGIIADVNGNIYVSEYYGNTYIYGNKNGAYTAEDMDNAIKRLPSSLQLNANSQQQVAYTNTRYNALSASEKTQVKEKGTLDRVNAQLLRLVQNRQADIMKRIDAIPAKIGLDDIGTIETLWNAYSALSSTEQKAITNADKLKQAVDYMYTIQGSVEHLIAGIDNLNLATLTLQDKVTVLGLQDIYAKLSTEDQKLVMNYAKLQQAVEVIVILEDQGKVQALIDDINELPLAATITLNNEKAIVDVYERYIALHKDVKKLVTNAIVLEKAYQEVRQQRVVVDTLNDDIWKGINPANITVKDEAKILGYEKRYTALSTVNKTYIKYHKDIVEAKETIKQLKKGIIPTSIFESLMGTDGTYTFEQKTAVYQFKGTNVNDPMDFKTGLTALPFDQQIKAAYPNALILYVNGGVAPGDYTLSLAVTCKDGSYPLYAYNVNKKAIQSAGNVQVKNGWFTIQQKEGMVYFVDTPKANGDVLVKDPATSPDTSDMSNPLLYMAFAMLSLPVISYTRKKRKAQQ